jgi:hypothetical protein
MARRDVPRATDAEGGQNEVIRQAQQLIDADLATRNVRAKE